MVTPSEAGAVAASNATSAPDFAFSSTVFSRSARTLVVSRASSQRRFADNFLPSSVASSALSGSGASVGAWIRLGKSSASMRPAISPEPM